MRYIALTLALLSACDERPTAQESAVAEAHMIATHGPYIDIDLQRVFEQYAANPVDADMRYKRKGVRFTAAVSNIIQGQDGEPLVFFGPDSDHNLIGCGGMNHNVVSLMNRGQVRTIHAAFVGEIQRLPMALFCEIE